MKEAIEKLKSIIESHNEMLITLAIAGDTKMVVHYSNEIESLKIAIQYLEDKYALEQYWNNYKIEQVNLEKNVEPNMIKCTYVITDSEGTKEIFHNVTHEIDDEEAFVVFSKNNEEVYINKNN